ncbi:dihydrolipoyllysine-residue acetyltransferase [Ectothiorhodospira variabilis]|uniref:dihydrolipoyllysine-residue acetyltransferase n=1 Tax=Ectothiorhodospira variabilis TaxID=505694 RepID=UPI001EFBD11B|nr:dihydrolipoyllysine-residue acetyltransferase [Ectothiorhodospira variabilis]MCG5494141.1 dihydrolipoyllysine-residue acetyltransferase [Ectothiorhodospira variabilis]MCG5497372.1 dihydrolipoyllysine-residue acetyltransferase [Ectothiorhodospira variabilis]MCG5503329.1 dihydrolipoyllysine-residue acetyltransferase [Ectothiorhodospira variabilis]MCG5506583.1 dihydrolipoyllysine-residue acetyltransferase [Ectothiorhodospira variabilis]
MGNVVEVKVPDIGDFKDVEIIEVLVSEGDRVEPEDSLITLESDKASMDIPSPQGGIVKGVKLKAGERVSEGTPILDLEVENASADEDADSTAKEDTATPSGKDDHKESAQGTGKEAGPARSDDTQRGAEQASGSSAASTGPRPSPTAGLVNEEGFRKAHASPAVRRFARELGVDLGRLEGSGRKGRILKEDVQAFVKRSLSQGASSGLGVPPAPEIDFSRFGQVETQALTKINRLTGEYLHRNWVTIPHVTQFDEADITELDGFRRSLVDEYKDKGVKITFLVFLMKAVVSALKEFPRVNSSLDAAGENLIVKKYYHLGIAVDTPDGLVVPVVRDVDRKSLVELARELAEISEKARKRRLKSKDMEGGCLTITSLGGIGGTHFTPIVNAPEVAILGVSKARMQPVWDGKAFNPRLVLPLSLSYDHRVIDGALGARFTSYLSGLLSDMRRMLL